jgi:enoyl-CoA hydratase/carnithine racemase
MQCAKWRPPESRLRRRAHHELAAHHAPILQREFDRDLAARLQRRARIHQHQVQPARLEHRRIEAARCAAAVQAACGSRRRRSSSRAIPHLACAALRAPMIVAGIAHGFSMRPKPACIGIPPGTSGSSHRAPRARKAAAVGCFAQAGRARRAMSGKRRSEAEGLHAAYDTGRPPRPDARMSLVERIAHGAIVELRLARAPVNALDPALCTRDCARAGRGRRGGAQGIVLSGGPKVFSAGLDVPFLLGLGDDRAALMAAWEAFFGAARALAESPVPIAAALAGHAPAGGCVLALCCDYRVMAEGPYRIGLNETQVGLVAPEGIQSADAPHRRHATRGAYCSSAARWSTRSARSTSAWSTNSRASMKSPRVRAWLEGAAQALPRQPMLQTRAIARADVVAAMQPERIQLDTLHRCVERAGYAGGVARVDRAAGKVTRGWVPAFAGAYASPDRSRRIGDPTAPRAREQASPHANPRAPSPASDGTRSRRSRTSPSPGPPSCRAEQRAEFVGQLHGVLKPVDQVLRDTGD